ncbi:MAG TPA: SUF system NifU family Fe-S cluster assembly protein [Gemmatimonadales bacterium]|nr:SUF system NifU family Fe-S cluster assembly protein [Gemmatimonadales bacterium]
MNDLEDLYQQLIIDHNRNPRNFRAMPDANRTAEGDNPLCGDRIKLYLRVEGGRVAEATFQGSGCAISKASASMMTQAVQGKSEEEAERLFQAFHAMVTSPATAPAETEALGKLAAFAGVRAFPARVKCANLAWHTLHAALAARAEPVSTE